MKKRIDANMRQFFLRFVVKLYIIVTNNNRMRHEQTAEEV